MVPYQHGVDVTRTYIIFTLSEKHFSAWLEEQKNVKSQYINKDSKQRYREKSKKPKYSLLIDIIGNSPVVIDTIGDDVVIQ